MKKIIKNIILITFLLFTTKVYAGSATVAVKTSASQVLVGNQITVTVTVSSKEALGSWEYTLDYDSSMFTLKTSDPGLHNVGVAENNSTKNQSYTYKFVAKKSGSANFKIASASVMNFNEEYLSSTKGSKTVNVITKEEYEASLSKVNTLSSLSVEGYEISPSFEVNTKEYSVTVPEGTTNINVKGTLTDKTASVSGLGSNDVANGTNVIKIKVTAQNGDENIYTLTVSVYDSNPINVNVNGKDYTIVKLKDYLTKPSSFEESTVTINEIEVPSFYSNITNYSLVGLKDAEGKITLFIYDSEKDSYEEYKELTFNNISLLPLEYPNILKGYKEYNETINNVLVKTLKYNETSRYSIIYGKNLETGETDYYEYDKENNTLIKYNDEYIKDLQKQKNKYLYLVLSFGVLLFGSVILNIILLSKKRKKK